MAAELSTLVSSFLDDKPENYASLLLECVDVKQHLNGDKAFDGWVGKVNSLLNSKNERWLGVCLLGRTIEQCDTDTFTTNCSTWIRAILQIIQVPERTSVIQYCSKLFDDLLKYAAGFPELSRELSNTVIPSFVSTLLSSKTVDAPARLSFITSCIHWFPGPVGTFKKRIENFLLPFFNSSWEEAVKAACHCYAALPRCGGGGASGSKQGVSWEEQWKKVLDTIHKLMDVAYENVEPVDSTSSRQCPPETLPLGDIPEVEPNRTHSLVTRCNNLLLCLSEMIREEFLKVVVVPIESTVHLLTRVLAVTGNSLKSAVVVESVLLRASLPLIHTSAIDLLTNLVARCGRQLFPYCDLLLKILVQELTWTRSQDPKNGQQRPYGKLRCSVYSCIERWVQVTKSLPEEGGVVSKLAQYIMEDIKPLSSQTKLLSTSSSGSQQSKKTKKRKIQEDVGQLLTGHQKLDKRANEKVTYRALKALSAMLISSGCDIPHDAFKEIQVCVVKLILQNQKSKHNSHAIPYDSPECRQALYHVLLSCVLTNLPQVPSPVNHAVRLFSFGLQDVDLKVSSFCQEALAVTNSIVHPRSFPHVSSAPGPLLLTTSEPSSLNGPSSADSYSISKTHTSGALDQNSMTGGEMTLQRQHVVAREMFVQSGGMNGTISQSELTLTERDECQTEAQMSSVAGSLAPVTHKTSETSLSSGALNTSACDKENETMTHSNDSGTDLDSSVKMTHVNQMYRTQSSAVGSDMSTAKPSNHDRASTQTTAPVANSEILLVEDGASFQKRLDCASGYADDGPSNPKRMRHEGAGSSMVAEKLSSSETTRDELASSRDKTETVTIEDDSDEAEKMLAAFVDSSPDSDEPELQ